MDIKFKANQETLRLCVKNVSPLVGKHAKRPELQNLLFNIRRGYTEETKARVWVSATDGIACTMQCFDVFDYEGPKRMSGLSNLESTWKRICFSWITGKRKRS